MPLPSHHPMNAAATTCPKCGGHAKEQGEFRAAGGFWSSFFDYSNQRFRYLACKNCGYTEFYKSSISGTAKLFDFLGGN